LVSKLLSSAEMRCAALILIWLGSLGAATLQKLTLSEMIEKSTAVVRAKVGQCASDLRGSTVYTTCQLSVLEQWKGQAASANRVTLPGGTAKGIRHIFAGVPALQTGDERIFFLWAGKSGEPQLIGLSQGLMRLEKLADGTVMAVRTPGRDRMLDTSGQPVWDEGIEMPFAELRRLVQAAGGQ